MNQPSQSLLALDVLEPTANVGYGKKSIPIDRDMEIETLLRTSLNERSLAVLHNKLNAGHQSVLRVFAERTATAAVRSKDQDSLRLALVALSLSGLEAGSRDSLAILPVQLHAAAEIQCDIRDLYENVRCAVGDRFSKPLFDFLKRSEEDKSLEAMGYSIGADTDGFRYVRDW